MPADSWLPALVQVQDYYNSSEAFEKFAKLTAIGILALTVMRKASRETDPAAYIAPWSALAQRLGFEKLNAAILEAEPQRWRAEAKAAHAQSGHENASIQSGLSGGWHNSMETRIQSWFTERIEPLLRVERELAVRKVPATELMSPSAARYAVVPPVPRAAATKDGSSESARAAKAKSHACGIL